jgi:lysyl-tRNA synthetase class 2
MIPALEDACGEKFPPGMELHTEEAGAFLKSVLKKMNVECSPPLTNARMLDKLVGEFIVSTVLLILINSVLTRFVVGGDLH